MKHVTVALLVAFLLAACGAPPSPSADVIATQAAPAQAVAATPTAAPTATNAPTPTPKAPETGETTTRSQDGAAMVYVPAGEFVRGSSVAQLEQVVAACVADGRGESWCQLSPLSETPHRSITLDAFWIDRTEVTNAQYRTCVEAGACTEPVCSGECDANADDLPRACVLWENAEAYCAWAGARLPTEAEWEKAARGTDNQVYPWGNEQPDCNRANLQVGGQNCVGQATAVGSYPSGASPYGALDMAGNVSEWVSDWLGVWYYADSPDHNPTGPASDTSRVIRGGSWNLPRYYARATCRTYYGGPPPECDSTVGFRCAVSAGE